MSLASEVLSSSSASGQGCSSQACRIIKDGIKKATGIHI